MSKPNLDCVHVIVIEIFRYLSFLSFHLNTSLILYIITFHWCHQIALDPSFNLTYCDLEYDD